MLGRRLHGGVRRETLVGHALQHEVAALERTLGMATRIVVRGPADFCDEQRELLQLELAEWLAEVELTREPEAVDGTRAVLPQVDLVDVRVHQLVFRVAHLERDGHQRFAHFAHRVPKWLLRRSATVPSCRRFSLAD